MLNKFRHFTKSINTNFVTSTSVNEASRYLSDEDMKYLLDKIAKSNKSKNDLKNFCYKL